MSTTRRAFLSTLLGAVAAGAAYPVVIEPWRVEVEKINIALNRLPAAFDGFRIAQISDLHFRPFTTFRQIAHVVQRVNELNPDLIVITGDFITEGHMHIAELMPALEKLRAPHGITGILGNHDQPEGRVITETIRQSGIEMLRNQGRELTRSGTSLFLAGVDSICGRGGSYPRLKDALAQRPPGKTTILLAHEPDFVDKVPAKSGVGLQLSGHSHGGQVCLPILGARILPAWGKKYWKGLYKVNGLQLYTNRGIGTTGIPVRFGSVPEITEITLLAQSPTHG